MNAIKYFFALCVCALTSYSQAQSRQINDIGRVLVGSWVYASEGKIFFERWTQVNDSLYRGEAGYRMGLKEVLLEDILIRENELGIFYEALVLNQNQGRRISFQLIGIPESSLEKSVFIFSNPDHDYPRYIKYAVEKGRMKAVISDKWSGGREQITYFTKE